MATKKRRIKSYIEKLQDRRWQQRRLEMLEKANWKCFYNPEHTGRLDVHHRYYVSGQNPWDYPDETLVVLCSHCHEEEEGRLFRIRHAAGMGGKQYQEQILAFIDQNSPPEYVIEEADDEYLPEPCTDAQSGFAALREAEETAPVAHPHPWSDILEAFSKKFPMQSGFAMEGILEGVENGVLTVRFPEQHPYAKVATLRPNVFFVLSEIVESIVGPGTKLAIV